MRRPPRLLDWAKESTLLGTRELTRILFGAFLVGLVCLAVGIQVLFAYRVTTVNLLFFGLLEASAAVLLLGSVPVALVQVRARRRALQRRRPPRLRPVSLTLGAVVLGAGIYWATVASSPGRIGAAAVWSALGMALILPSVETELIRSRRRD